MSCGAIVSSSQLAVLDPQWLVLFSARLLYSVYVTAALFDRHTRPFSSGLAQNRRRNENQGKQKRDENTSFGGVTELFVPVSSFQAPQLIPRRAISATHPHPGRVPDATPGFGPGQINVRHRPPLFH